jgi:hypothetical protein
MFWRGQLDLAIPKEVYDAIPADRKIAFRDEIRTLKALATKINAGTPNEEMTVKAKWHWCTHDENPATDCSLAEQDI